MSGHMGARLMSAGGESGYPTNQPLTFDPGDSDNPTTGTETAGAYLYKWNHDNSGDEWYDDLNLPFQLDWESGENQPFISVAPYSTGCRVIIQMMPVSPAWAQAVIDAYSLSQSGTLGNYDKYPCTIDVEIECDGVELEMDTEVGPNSILLWTADNDAYAVIYTDSYTLDDDSSLETKLAAANPGQWGTDDFEIRAQVTGS